MSRRKLRRGMIKDKHERRATFERLTKEIKEDIYELSIEENVDIMAVVFSPTGKPIYLSGKKSPNEIIDRFLNDTDAVSDPRNKGLVEMFKRVKLEREMAAKLAREKPSNENPPVHSKAKNLDGDGGAGASNKNAETASNSDLIDR